MKNVVPILIFWVLVVGVLGIYWPGLDGPFLFDDFANLKALGNYGGVRNLETLKLFLADSYAGPSGRPISVLSFLLNDVNWPSTPWSFKFTNLLIHLLNGVLLYWLIYRLMLLTKKNEYTSTWIALLTAGVWLLHPLNVSTTLYVIQRMAMLSALFVILGLLLYVYGRSILASQTQKGYLLMTVAIIVFTPLAVFSKENGCLLPILALVIEYTVIRHGGNHGKNPTFKWTFVFLWGPLALLMLYVGDALISGRLQNAFNQRPFTLGERLFTESRILFDYLYHWYIPHFQNRGLFGDDYLVSTNLVSPLSTVFSVIGILVCGFVGVLIRKRHPLISLSILFYFTGHLIESTVFPLELYFEHRNYLPAIFLFLPICYSIVVYTKQYPVLKIAGILLLSIPATMTASEAKIWSNDVSLSLSWAYTNPRSPRAQRVAAMALNNAGRSDLALTVLKKASIQIPNNIPVRLHYLLQKCLSKGVNASDLRTTLKILETVYYDFHTFEFLKTITTIAPSEACKGIARPDVFEILKALEKNPGNKNKGGPARQIYHLRGRLYLSENDPASALREFEKAFQLRPIPDTGMLEVSLLARSSMYHEALEHLDNVSQVVKRTPLSKRGRSWKLDYQAEIKRMRQTLEQDIANQ